MASLPHRAGRWIDYQQDHILATLPEEVRSRIQPPLELVPMPLGKRGQSIRV